MRAKFCFVSIGKFGSFKNPFAMITSLSELHYVEDLFFAKNQQSFMHWFLIILEKPHFKPILGSFWPNNLKIRIFPIKLFRSILMLYPTVNICKEIRKIVNENFSRLEKSPSGVFHPKNPRRKMWLSLFRLDDTVISCKNFLWAV